MKVRQRNSSEYADQTDIESISMLYDGTEPVAGNNMDFTNSVDVLARIARSRVRWGVVEMPPEFYRTLLRGEQVGHLSFGVEEDEVLPPEPGRWYL
ncbi:hypothetical protein F5Y09DRAFT_325447 [Xylaria sp. FL1042]|nr:hypothetical protein F5Y09DRAFT_325447 [Xylaria sp. FL1042]